MGGIEQFGGGTSGADQLIASSVLAAPAASVTFASIPQTYNHLRVLCVARSLAAGTDTWVLTLNGDTGVHYDRIWTGVHSDAGTTGAVQSTNGATNAMGGGGSAGLSDLATAADTAGVPALFEMFIPAYAQTALQKVYRLYNGYNDGAKPGYGAVATAFGAWRSTAAVTQIAIANFSGTNFVTGSAFYLYGIK